MLKNKSKEKALELFKSIGIIMTPSELEKMAKMEVTSIIDEAYKQRKLKQFLEYPILSNIKDNVEIARDVIRAIRDKENPLCSILLKDNPKISQETLVNYIERMILEDKEAKENSRMVYIALPFIGFIVAFIAFLIYKFC